MKIQQKVLSLKQKKIIDNNIFNILFCIIVINVLLKIKTLLSRLFKLIFSRTRRRIHRLCGHQVVSSAGTSGGRHAVRTSGGRLGHRVRLRRTPERAAPVAGKVRRGPALLDSENFGSVSVFLK